MELKPILLAFVIWLLSFLYTLGIHAVWPIWTGQTILGIIVFTLLAIPLSVVFGPTENDNETNAKKYKTQIFLSISIAIGILIIFIFNIFQPIDNAVINIVIAIWAFLTSVLWFVTGNLENKTEPGLHWYIGTLTLIGAVFCLVNAFKDAGVSHIVIIAIIVIIHMFFLYHLWSNKNPNKQNCTLITKVTIVLVILCELIIGVLINMNTAEYMLYVVHPTFVISMFTLGIIKCHNKQEDGSYEEQNTFMTKNKIPLSNNP